MNLEQFRLEDSELVKTVSLVDYTERTFDIRMSRGLYPDDPVRIQSESRLRYYGIDLEEQTEQVSKVSGGTQIGLWWADPDTGIVKYYITPKQLTPTQRKQIEMIYPDGDAVSSYFGAVHIDAWNYFRQNNILKEDDRDKSYHELPRGNVFETTRKEGKRKQRVFTVEYGKGWWDTPLKETLFKYSIVYRFGLDSQFIAWEINHHYDKGTTGGIITNDKYPKILSNQGD